MEEERKNKLTIPSLDPEKKELTSQSPSLSSGSYSKPNDSAT